MKRFTVLLSAAMVSLAFAGNAVELEKSITIASVQYPIEGNQNLESLLRKIESFVLEAKKKRADLILFPEWVVWDLWPLGKGKSGKDMAHEVADHITPSFWEALKGMAKKYNIILVGASTAEKDHRSIKNTAIFAFPDGRFYRQPKNYRTAWEIENGIQAGKGIEVIDTRFGKMALLLCFDVEFPDLSYQLASRGIDLFLVPSMTESKEGAHRVRWTAQARAVEHTSYVVISPTVGEVTPTWKHFGVAAFLTPQLEGFEGLLREGTVKKGGVVVQTLDLKALREAKKTSPWQPAKQILTRSDP